MSHSSCISSLRRRAAVEANHGRIYARNLAGAGCIFTVDLPRSTRAATSVVHPAA